MAYATTLMSPIDEGGFQSGLVGDNSGSATTAQQSGLGDVPQVAATSPQGTTIPTSSAGLTNGLVTGSQLAAFQPASYQEFGSIPQVASSSYSSTNVDNSQIPGALQASENLNQQALEPTFQAQQQSLDDNLASRGIVNSGASTYLDQNLSGQQDAALAGVDSSLISQYAGYNQADETQNASAANTANEFNAEAAQQAGEYNATSYGNVVQGNENNYNSFLNDNYNNATAYSNGLIGDFLGSYGTANNEALGTLGQGATSATNAYEQGLSSGSGNGLGTAVQGGITALGSALSNATPSNPYGPGSYIDPNQGTYDPGVDASGVPIPYGQ